MVFVLGRLSECLATFIGSALMCQFFFSWVFSRYFFFKGNFVVLEKDWQKTEIQKYISTEIGKNYY